MSREQSEGSKTDSKTNRKSNGERRQIEKEHVGKFIGSHWLGVTLFGLSIFFMSPILNFPGGNPKQLWWVCGGTCLLVCTLIVWGFYWKIAQLSGADILTAEQIEKQESDYKQRIESEITTLKTNVVQLGARRLSQVQRQTILGIASLHRGQKVSISALLWDTEAARYAQDFLEVLVEAGWDFGGKGISNATFPLSFDNVQIGVGEGHTKETLPPGAVPLQLILDQLGITTSKGFMVYYPGTPRDEVAIRVGAKPPPSTQLNQ